MRARITPSFVAGDMRRSASYSISRASIVDMTYCPRCGAELGPDGRCRFTVPAEEAPWLPENDAKGGDRESLLPTARWILHHPDEAAGRLEWARRTAGMEE